MFMCSGCGYTLFPARFGAVGDIFLNLLAAVASGADMFSCASIHLGKLVATHIFFQCSSRTLGKILTHLDSYLLDWVGKHQLVNIEAISRLCEARDEHS